MSEDKKTILLVDDSKFLRRQLKKFLEKEGYSVVGDASNGIEGLSGFKEHQPDLVLLDITMPDMNGNLVFAKLKAIAPDVQVVLMSGYTHDQIMEQFDPSNIAGFLKVTTSGFCSTARYFPVF